MWETVFPAPCFLFDRQSTASRNRGRVYHIHFFVQHRIQYTYKYCASKKMRANFREFARVSNPNSRGTHGRCL